MKFHLVIINSTNFYPPELLEDELELEEEAGGSLNNFPSTLVPGE